MKTSLFPRSPRVTVKTFSLQHINDNDELFNVNNLYGDKQPDDYWDVSKYAQTDKWVDLFHERERYHKIKLDKTDIEWMKKAVSINMIYGRFSSIFEDDLEMLCKKYSHRMDEINKHGNKWFIRTENFSLKHSRHGAGPYNCLRKIFESMTTFTLGHSNIMHDDEEKTIYFIPWVEIERDKEFRVFVHQNKIVAISQQHLYEVNNWIQTISPVEEIVDKIVEYFEDNVKEKMKYMGGNYVMDFAFVGENDTPYFIEPGAYGKNYGAGSSLFHWINDEKILYGTGDTIEFRFVERV